MIKQLIKGVATWIPGVYAACSHTRAGATRSARYCYAVWLRHLVSAAASGLPAEPRVIAEFGPGDTLGVGLAALLTGAERYYALDVVAYASGPENREVFEGLVELLRRREAIPGDEEFPEVLPRLASYAFPDALLTTERLGAALDGRRLALIRRSLEGGDREDAVVRYAVPWGETGLIEPASLDMIFSQAALEHVDDLAGAYARMQAWLGPAGFLSHTIDFRSHGTADTWDGHWARSETAWRLIRGRRPYLINRQPCSRHLALLRRAGFSVVRVTRRALRPTLRPGDLAPGFRDLDAEDLTTGGAFIQARK